MPDVFSLREGSEDITQWVLDGFGALRGKLLRCDIPIPACCKDSLIFCKDFRNIPIFQWISNPNQKSYLRNFPIVSDLFVCFSKK